MKRPAIAKQIGGVLIEEIFIAEQRCDHNAAGRAAEIIFEISDQLGTLVVNPCKRQKDALVGDFLDKQPALYRAGRINAEAVEELSFLNHAGVEKFIVAV